MSAKLYLNAVVSYSSACLKVHFEDFVTKLIDEEHSGDRLLLSNHEVTVGD